MGWRLVTPGDGDWYRARRAGFRPVGLTDHIEDALKFLRGATDTYQPEDLPSPVPGAHTSDSGVAMFADRRSYSLCKDQPILEQARRRRSAHLARPKRPESEFWKSFNLEKFARDWGRGVGVRQARG